MHVRRPLRRKRGNQNYRDKSVRETSTYCGASVTDTDWSHQDGKRHWASIPCTACAEAMHEESKR